MDSPFILPAARRRPSSLGLRAGQLAACPNSPNCVSSRATKSSQRVEPLRYDELANRGAARTLLLELLTSDSKATIISQSDEYVHAEYRALVFIDDLELSFPSEEPVVHIRSASRLGKSDLGANRRRVEALRKAFLSRL